jgi:hypothetical protein
MPKDLHLGSVILLRDTGELNQFLNAWNEAHLKTLQEWEPGLDLRMVSHVTTKCDSPAKQRQLSIALYYGAVFYGDQTGPEDFTVEERALIKPGMCVFRGSASEDPDPENPILFSLRAWVVKRMTRKTLVGIIRLYDEDSLLKDDLRALYIRGFLVNPTIMGGGEAGRLKLLDGGLNFLPKIFLVGQNYIDDEVLGQIQGRIVLSTVGYQGYGCYSSGGAARIKNYCKAPGVARMHYLPLYKGDALGEAGMQLVGAQEMFGQGNESNQFESTRDLYFLSEDGEADVRRTELPGATVFDSYILSGGSLADRVDSAVASELVRVTLGISSFSQGPTLIGPKTAVGGLVLGKPTSVNIYQSNNPAANFFDVFDPGDSLGRYTEVPESVLALGMTTTSESMVDIGAIGYGLSSSSAQIGFTKELNGLLSSTSPKNWFAGIASGRLKRTGFEEAWFGMTGGEAFNALMIADMFSNTAALVLIAPVRGQFRLLDDDTWGIVAKNTDTGMTPVETAEWSKVVNIRQICDQFAGNDMKKMLEGLRRRMVAIAFALSDERLGKDVEFSQVRAQYVRACQKLLFRWMMGVSTFRHERTNIFVAELPEIAPICNTILAYVASEYFDRVGAFYGNVGDTLEESWEALLVRLSHPDQAYDPKNTEAVLTIELCNQLKDVMDDGYNRGFYWNPRPHGWHGPPIGVVGNTRDPFDLFEDLFSEKRPKGLDDLIRDDVLDAVKKIVPGLIKPFEQANVNKPIAFLQRNLVKDHEYGTEKWRAKDQGHDISGHGFLSVYLSDVMFLTYLEGAVANIYGLYRSNWLYPWKAHREVWHSPFDYLLAMSAIVRIYKKRASGRPKEQFRNIMRRAAFFARIMIKIICDEELDGESQFGVDWVGTPTDLITRASERVAALP